MESQWPYTSLSSLAMTCVGEGRKKCRPLHHREKLHSATIPSTPSVHTADSEHKNTQDTDNDIFVRVVFDLSHGEHDIDRARPHHVMDGSQVIS